MKRLCSVLSFPERGPYGKASYRGNCSGYVVKAILEFLRPKECCDPAEGSGTTGDVCRELGIHYVGFDLMTGFNLLKDSLIERLGKPFEFIFFHPPYHDIIRYSGSQWGNAHPDDLSRCETVDDFLSKIEIALWNISKATDGHFAVLIGDVRKNGNYYPFQSDIIRIVSGGMGRLKSHIIKVQHNVTSDRINYSGKFIPIMHEHLLLFERRRDIQTFFEYVLSRSEELKRESNRTWRSLVRLSLEKLGGKAHLSSLYEVIEREDPNKVGANLNWQAKVRQVLQKAQDFIRVGEGVWAIA